MSGIRVVAVKVSIYLKKNKTKALTFVEVLVVIFVSAVLVAVLLSALAASKRKSSRIGCVNNLKQIELSMKIWAGDNKDSYPMQLSITNGGTMEVIATGDVVSTFTVISNELNTPKVLVCPDDAGRIYATNFDAGLTPKNTSYFVAIDGGMNHPSEPNLGDNNLVVNGHPVAPGVLDLATNTATWTKERHHFRGNIGFNDGSVMAEVTKIGFTSMAGTVYSTNHIAIP